MVSHASRDPLQSLSVASSCSPAGTSVSLYGQHSVRHQELVLTGGREVLAVKNCRHDDGYKIEIGKTVEEPS